jgi:hypothetical protein
MYRRVARSSGKRLNALGITKERRFSNRRSFTVTSRSVVDCAVTKRKRRPSPQSPPWPGRGGRKAPVRVGVMSGEVACRAGVKQRRETSLIVVAVSDTRFDAFVPRLTSPLPSRLYRPGRSHSRLRFASLEMTTMKNAGDAITVTKPKRRPSPQSSPWPERGGRKAPVRVLALVREKRTQSAGQVVVE